MTLERVSREKKHTKSFSSLTGSSLVNRSTRLGSLTKTQWERRLLNEDVTISSPFRCFVHGRRADQVRQSSHVKQFLRHAFVAILRTRFDFHRLWSNSESNLLTAATLSSLHFHNNVRETKVSRYNGVSSFADTQDI